MNAEEIGIEIERLSAEYRRITAGCAVVSPRAKKISDKIFRLRNEREQILTEQAQPLGMYLPENDTERNEVYHSLLKIPIAADFLYATCVECGALLRRHGLNELTMTKQCEEICRKAKDLAFMLSKIKGTEVILDCDDTVIQALGKKTDSYIKRFIPKKK